ncbi:hypothetical protein [uncultured Ruegeria sp.]|uniref:hypothetical protein n=1 Tax=uncultured Ruegeria sp. TaxID=259304 RepID=UPI00345B5A37
MQRRANFGFNKGKAHRASWNRLRIDQPRKILGQPAGDQHFPIAGMNLFKAIINSWNIEQLDLVVPQQKKAGKDAPG